MNQFPKLGSETFPIGTIIVKESGTGDLPTRHVFAMVKRGGGYNADGMKGWELFELQNIDSDRASILWRGLGPTNGDAYGGDKTGGCNSCHGAAASWDYAFTGQVLGLITPKPR